MHRKKEKERETEKKKKCALFRLNKPAYVCHGRFRLHMGFSLMDLIEIDGMNLSRTSNAPMYSFICDHIGVTGV